MNNILIKTMIGFLSLGAVTGAGVLTKNYTDHNAQLTNIAKADQKNSYLEYVKQEKLQAEKELNEAKEAKAKAEKEVKNAEETINKASKEKEEAMLELKNAKTPEERKIAQEKIDAATSKLEQAKKTKKLAEKKVEEASKTVEQKEENKQNIEEKLAAVKEKENKQNQNTSSKKSASNSNVKNNKTTTKQKEEEEQGSKYDLSNYPEILNKINEETKRQEEEIRKEAEKKTVEFHFYSTNKTLPIRCTESFCGDSGHIWFIEVECDLNKCEGFTDSKTGAKVGTLLIARRADITNLTLTAPAAKYGYKFMGWELISSRKAVSNELGEGVLSGKYIATYEKA